MTTETQPPGEIVSAPTAEPAPNEAPTRLTAKQVKKLGQNRDYWERRAKKSEAERNDVLAKIYTVYAERNRLAAALARIFPGSHLVQGTANMYTDQTKERRIIRDICCVHLPDGRNLTWHFSPDEARFFGGIPYREDDYDGHTDSQKYGTLEEVSIATVLEAVSVRLLISPA